MPSHYGSVSGGSVSLEAMPFLVDSTTHICSSGRPVPELRIYRVFDKPVGPHIVAMFEVNIFTPRQFGAFIPWLVVHRGPLSALIHPNTDDELRDHTQRATWMGEKFPLDLSQLRRGD